MLGLFKSRNKVDRFFQLEKSLNNVTKDIESLAIEFNLKNRQKEEFLKVNKIDDIRDRVLGRFNNFEKSHIQNLGKVKRKREALISQLNAIRTDELEQIVKSRKQDILYSSVLSKYKSGVYDLGTCNRLLKAIKKEKVKYADNIVFNEKGQILLLKRSEIDKSKPGYFTIPGGHVDPGEDCEVAAKRELLEEAGVTSDITVQVGEYEDSDVHIKYFQSYVENVEPILQESEIWSYEWVFPKDLHKYSLPFNMGDNLNKILFPNRHKVIKIKKSFEDGLITSSQRDRLLKGVIHNAKGYIEEIKEIELTDEPGAKGNSNILGSFGRSVIKAVKEVLSGGMADGKTVKQIAEHHNSDIGKIQSELKIGIPIELEHTDDLKEAKEIACDHLWEIKDYYTRLQKMESEAKGEKLKSLYDELAVEFSKVQNLKSSLIEKSMGGGYIENITNIIEKAKKDITKLKQIKKLITRDGKTFFSTFYVKTGEEIVDEKKYSEPIGFDIQIGDKVSFKKGKENWEGDVLGFSYSEENKEHWFAILNKETGKRKYFSTKKISDIVISGGKKQKPEEEFTFVKELGGSTGAQLVKDKYGNLFVKKTGKDKEHIQAEYDALKIYKAFGIQVPHIHEYDPKKGELYTEYYKDSKTLGEYISGGGNIYEEFSDHSLQLGVGVDILLANWDAVGLDKDNILSVKGQYSYRLSRVDVGGSLGKRAQGEDKPFTGDVLELKTMLDPNINPQYAEVFGKVDLLKSLKRVTQRFDNLAMSSIPEKYRSVLGERINTIKSFIKEKNLEGSQEIVDKINYKGKIFDIHKGYFGKKIHDFYEKVNEDMKVTAEDFALLKEMDSDYKSEESSNYMFEKVSNLEPSIISEIKELGVTPQELLAISSYTESSFLGINKALQEYTDSNTGNINLSTENVSFFAAENKDIKSPLDNHFEAILDAAKSINFHHNKGDTDYNVEKMSKYNTTAAKILLFKNDIGINMSKYTEPEIKSINYLYDKVVEMNQSIYNKSTTIGEIEKPSYFSEIKYKKELKTPNQGLVHNYKNLMEESIDKDTRCNFVKAKLIVNGLRKMEDSMNPDINIKGTFTRFININPDTRSDFIKQHKTEGDYVVHQRTGGSAYKKVVFESNNTKLMIHGSGVNISHISHYKGEQEVLHKPFTMFRNSSLIDDGANMVVVLDKII